MRKLTCLALISLPLERSYVLSPQSSGIVAPLVHATTISILTTPHKPFDIESQLKQIREQLQVERRLREEAEEHAEQGRQRAEQAGEQTRHTNFEELLESCHHLSQSMSVQIDKSLSTQGSTGPH